MIGNKNKRVVKLERNENTNGEKHEKNSMAWLLVNYLTLMAGVKQFIKSIFTIKQNT